MSDARWYGYFGDGGSGATLVFVTAAELDQLRRVHNECKVAPGGYDGLRWWSEFRSVVGTKVYNDLARRGQKVGDGFQFRLVADYRYGEFRACERLRDGQ